jgi:exosortase
MTGSETLPACPATRTAETRWWHAVALVAALVLPFLPLLFLHGRQLWLRPHYQFFPLLLLGAGVLVWWHRATCPPLRPGNRFVTGGLLTLAWLLLAAAELLYSSWLAAVSVLVLAAGLLWAFGGARLFRHLLPAWLLLWLAVPPPLDLDRELILAMQGWTARASSAVLDMLGVFHVMAGNVVEVDGRKLLVAEACSGINSLFSVLACTMFLMFLMRRPIWHCVVLLASAVGWVLAANVARVVCVVLLETRCDIDVTSRWVIQDRISRHDAFGAAFFAVAVGLLWSTDQLLLFLSTPSASAPTPAPAATPATDSVPASSPSRGFLLVTVVAFLVLGVGHVACYGLSTNATAVGGPSLERFDRFNKDDALPAQVAGWQRGKFHPDSRSGSDFGDLSRSWEYKKGSHMVLFSLDYPFPAWHDLTRCYKLQGWRVEGQEIVEADDRSPGIVVVQLSKPAYRSGFLLFCQVDREGQSLEPRKGGAFMSLYRHGSMARRWSERLFGTEASSAPCDPPGPVYQMQLLVESANPLSEADMADVRELFTGLVAEVRRQWPVENGSARAER